MSRRTLNRNAADRVQLDRAEKLLKARARQRFDLLRTQLATYQGREFVWQELERHGIFDLPRGTVEQTFEFLGKREAGIVLYEEISRGHADAFLLMQKEAIARAKREEDEIDGVNAPVSINT